MKNVVTTHISLSLSMLLCVCTCSICLKVNKDIVEKKMMPSLCVHVNISKDLNTLI